MDFMSSDNDDTADDGYSSMFNMPQGSSVVKSDGSYAEVGQKKAQSNVQMTPYQASGLPMYPAGYIPNYGNFFPTHQQAPPMPQMSPMSQMSQMFTGANLAMGTGFSLGENYGSDFSPKVTTPTNCEFAPLIKDKNERNSKMDEVSGRLCLLSGTKKYAVSIGEICRRMSSPETLHTSLLNSILRNAKAKDNGSRLRSNLRNYNIDLPQGRRKTCRTTGFTALCEGEANQLAKDFNELLLDKGGADEIGKVYAAQQLSESNPEDAIKEAEAVEKIANFLMGSHKADQLPDDMECNNSMEKSIMTLSLFTHGFSHVAIHGLAQFLKAIAEVMKTHVHNQQASSVASPVPGLSRMSNMLSNNYYNHHSSTSGQ